MNRRNFLKGFSAATGTLAVAPALALAPVEPRFNVSAGGSSIRGLPADIIIDDIEEMYYAEQNFRKSREYAIRFMNGKEWNPTVIKKLS